MKWALCVSTGTNELKVYAFCDTGYPRTDENGWYHAFMDGGDTVFVQKKFVAFMYPLKRGEE